MAIDISKLGYNSVNVGAFTTTLNGNVGHSQATATADYNGTAHNLKFEWQVSPVFSLNPTGNVTQTAVVDHATGIGAIVATNDIVKFSLKITDETLNKTLNGLVSVDIDDLDNFGTGDYEGVKFIGGAKFLKSFRRPGGNTSPDGVYHRIQDGYYMSFDGDDAFASGVIVGQVKLNDSGFTDIIEYINHTSPNRGPRQAWLGVDNLDLGLKFPITKKLNCGCTNEIGYVDTLHDGTILDTHLDSSEKMLSGNLTGNLLTSVSGLSVKNTCDSPAWISGYNILDCGIQVNVGTESYVAQFVNENGCALDIPGAQDQKEPVCSKSDPRLNPAVPKNWEKITLSGCSTGDCDKVVWSGRGECNVVTKQIYIKHKTVQFTEQVDVNWYDNCNFRGNLGTITRNVVEDQVTGDRIYDQWDNSLIKFSKCIPFVGLFEQMGSDNNGNWRPLMIDRGWELLSETLNCDCHELKVNLLYSKMCTTEKNEQLAQLKPISRNNSCDSCCDLTPNRIQYTTTRYEVRCNTSNCGVRNSTQTSNINTSNCGSCKN